MAAPRRDHRFRNWARTHAARPEQYHLPESEEEIVRLVREAAASRATIKVVGGGHSWNDIACTDGHMLSLDRCAGLVAVDARPGSAGRVTVQAGMRLRELHGVLARHGLAMSNLGSISEQSVAGAISTGTHGTGARFGNLATQVVALRLVTGAGEVLALRDDDPDPERSELLRAARVSLGCLGVITEVTLACEPAFRLEEHTFRVPFDEAVARLDELIDSGEHVKLWWLPHTDTVQVYRLDRSARPVDARSAFLNWFEHSALLRSAFAALLWLGRPLPSAIPGINRFVHGFYFPVERKRRGASHRIFNTPMPPRHREVEYAIPRAAAAGALRRLRALIDEGGLRVNFIAELRFVAADENLLSPAYGRPTCHFGAYMYTQREPEPYFEAFERLMLELGGRPHWGKEFHAAPEALRAAFPGYDRFDALRRRLDPHGLFENAFVRRVFPPR